MRGFARIAAAVPICEVANVEANRRSILRLWQRAHDEGHAVVVFPELCLTGYTARDLFLDHHLLERARQGLGQLADEAESLAPLAVVGVPLPMVSYGGTAMWATLAGFGLIMSCHVYRHSKVTRA